VRAAGHGRQDDAAQHQPERHDVDAEGAAERTCLPRTETINRDDRTDHDYTADDERPKPDALAPAATPEPDKPCGSGGGCREHSEQEREARAAHMYVFGKLLLHRDGFPFDRTAAGPVEAEAVTLRVVSVRCRAQRRAARPPTPSRGAHIVFRAMAETSAELVLDIGDRLVGLVVSEIPIVVSNAVPREHRALQSLLVKTVSIMRSLLDLTRRGRYADVMILARSLGDHVITFAWLAVDPEAHYRDGSGATPGIGWLPRSVGASAVARSWSPTSSICSSDREQARSSTRQI
jgi:hypothetical protein